MANRLQQLIYRLSSAVPLALVFSLVFYLENESILVPLICIGFSLFITTTFFIFFYYAKRHLSSISINITEITQGDHYIMGYIISYLLPLSNTVIKDMNHYTSAIIAIVILIVMPFINSATPNPLLFVTGYHFYHIGSENGVKDYLLISKQKLRSKEQIKLIKRLFEYVLIDR